MSSKKNNHPGSATDREQDRNPAVEGEDEAAAVAAKDEYDRGLLTRGEAAVAKDGKLPPGATHEIVGKTADGKPILRRRRFSAF